MARGTKNGPARSPHPLPAPPRRAPNRRWLLATTALLPIAAGQAMAQPAPAAGPTGGQVVAGQAGIARTPGRTTVTQGTDRAAIDWQQFNVGSQHTVQFVQPAPTSWTLNRVVGPDPSVIAGRVQANGGVAIVNQSGVVFAGGAQVDVGSLIASAAGITNQNFMAGRMVFDQAPRPGARVENHGTITVADRGLAALVGPGVANSGVIRARLGRVALGAAETFVLDLAGDGLIGIDVTQAVRTAPEGGAALVTNSGVIDAPGGSVLLSAHAASGLVEDLVRQTGTIAAQTVGDRTGQVALRAEGGGVRVEGAIDATGGAGQRGGSVALQATGAVTVAGTARVDASGGAGGGRVLVGTTGRGRDQRMAARTTVEAGAVIRADATQAGQGGEILVNSTTRTEMRGTLSARGGAAGGDGGFVEVSGQQALLISGFIDLAAPSGTPGELLIDPQNIIVSNANSPGVPGGENVVGGEVTTPGAAFNATTGDATDWLQVETGAITGFNGTVTLNAARDIIVEDAVTKANNQGGLGLIAGRNVTIGAAISVDGALTLTGTTGSIAIGADLRATSLTMTAGTGITQSGGNIRHRQGAGTALTLAATTATGGISLDRQQNGSLSVTFSAPGAVAIRSGNNTNGAGAVEGVLAVAGASSGGSVVLTSERADNASVLGTIAINAAVTSAAGITLNADGAITQGAAGTLTTARDATGVLRIRGRSGGSTDAASAVLDVAPNRIATLDARTTGALAVTSLGFAEDVPLALAANPTMLVTLAAGGSVSLAAPRLNLPNGTAAATGDVVLSATEAAAATTPATSLTIAGAVTAGDGQAVRLRADRMDLTGASFDGTGANTSLGLVEVGPATAGRALRFGGTDNDAALWLNGASVTAVTGAETATLRLGRTTLAGAAGTIAGGDIDFQAGLTIAGTLALGATGAITQAAATVLDAGTLAIRGATDATGAASAALDLANVIDTLDARVTGSLVVNSEAPVLTVLRASGSDVRLTATDLVLGDATVGAAGANVRLVSDAGILQGTGGAILAATFSASAAGGNLALSGSGNQIAAIVADVTAPDNGLLADTSRGLFASGAIALATSGTLVVQGAVDARGPFAALTAGAITLEAPIAVSGASRSVTLVADGGGGPGGNILQSTVLAAPILASSLAVAGTGDISLTGAGNTVQTLEASAAGGAFSLAVAGTLTVAGDTRAGTTLALTAGGAGALTVGAALTTPDNGTIRLTGTGITQNALIRAGDEASPSGGTVELDARTGGITQATTAARIVADTLEVTADAEVNLRAGLALGAGGSPAAWNAIGALVADVPANVSLLNAGDLSVAGTLGAAGAGGFTALVTSGTLTLAPFSVGLGATTLAAETNTLAGGTGIVLGAGSVFGAGGAGTVGVLTSGTGGTITQDATSVIRANELRIVAGGDATLAAAGNEISRLAATAAATDATIGISVRSSLDLTTVAAAGQVLMPDNTLRAAPVGVVSNAITLQAPNITLGLGAGLSRADAALPGTVVLIADTINTNGQPIEIGDGGVFGLAADDPTTEILVGDLFTSPPALPVPQLAPYTFSIVPDTSGNTYWISGAYLNSLIAGGTTNATLQVGRADQTGRTFVIGDLAPSATFGTFRLLGGTVIIGADVTAPGRNVQIVAGTGGVLSSGTFTQIVTQYLYDPTNFFFPGFNAGPYGAVWSIAQQAAVASNGVITAGALSVSAPSGSVTLNTVAHNVDSLSGSALGTFAFRNLDGFQVGPAGSGGIAAGARVTLAADTGSITQAAGSPIDTAAFEVSLPAGALVLDGGSPTSSLAADLNRIDSLAVAFSANNGITIRNDGDLALNTFVNAAAGDVTLHSQSGNITQPSSLIQANTLRVSAPSGSVTLNNGAVPATNVNVAANVLGGLGASTVAGDFVLRTFQDLSITGQVLVGSAAGGTTGAATLVSRIGSIVQQAGGSIAADSLTAVAPGGSILLNGAIANSVGTLLASNAAADVRLFSDRALTVAGAITGGAGGTIDLRSTGALDVDGGLSALSINLQSGGAITTTAAITGGAGGSVTLLGTGSGIIDVGAGISGGALSLTTGGAIDVGGALSGTTSVAVQGGGDVNVTAGITGGSVTVNGTGILDVGAAISGTAISLTSGGALDLGAGVSGTSIALQSGGAIDVGAIVAGGTVTATAAGLFDIGANVTGTTIRLTGGGAMTVGADISGTSIELQGAGIALGLGTTGGTLTAGRVLLRTGADFDPATGSATGGSIVQNAGTIETTQFSASAPGGNITLAAIGNTFGTVVAGADAGGAAAAAGIVAGGNVTLTADGTTALGVASPIRAGWDAARTGVTITLTADNMALNAAIDTRGPGATNRTDGTIAIAPLTATRPVVLGGLTEFGGYLVLQSGEVANLQAGTVTVTTANATEGLYLTTATFAPGTTLAISAPAGFVSQFGGPISVARLGATANSFVSVNDAGNLIPEITGVSAGGAISLASASPLLTLSGPVASSLDGGVITLRVNDLAIGAGSAITVPNGTVDISGVAAGRAISLGTEVANTLGLSSAEIGRIGQTTNPLALVRIGDATSATISLQGDVSFRDAPTDASGVVGGVRALALDLRAATASGDIVQTGATGGINVATLSAVARQVSLTSPDNAVDRIGALSAGGGAALRSSRDLTLPLGVTASAANGTLAITSDGTLLVQGAATASGLAGDVALTGLTGLALDTASVVSAARDATLTAGPATGNGVATLGIAGPVTAGGSIRASATGTLTVTQDLTATAGDIDLRTTAPGTQPPANVVLAPSVGGDGITVLRATGASGLVSLTATGNVVQPATGTLIVANALQVQAGGTIGLGDTQNQVTELRSLTAGGTASVSVQDGLRLTGTAAADDRLTLSAGTTLEIAAGGAAQVANAGGVLDLTAGTTLTIGGTATGETVNLSAGGQVAIAGGTVTGGGAGTGGLIAIDGASLLVNGGAAITAETVTATITPDGITIDASTVRALGADGVLSLSAAGALGITGGTVGGDTVGLAAGTAGLSLSGVALTAGVGGASLTSGGTAAIVGGTSTVTGGTLLLRGQGATSVTGGGTHQATGGVQVTSLGAGATVSGTTIGSLNGTVALSGATFASMSGTVTAGADVRLTGTTDFALVSGGGVTAAGDIVLQGQTQALISGGTHRANGAVQVTATGGQAELVGTTIEATTGGVTLSGTAATIAGSTVTAGGTVGLTGTTGAATIGSGSGVTAGGDITLQGQTQALISGGTHQAAGEVRLTSAGGTAILSATTIRAIAGGVTLSGTAAAIDASSVTAGGTVALTGSAGAATMTNDTVNAGGSIALQGQTVARISGGVHVAAQDITLASAGGAAEALATTLTATGGTLSLAGVTATMTSASLTAGTAIALTGTGGAVTTTNGTLASGGAITLQAAGLATVSATGTTAGGATSIAGGGGVRLLGGTHSAATGFAVNGQGGTTEINATTITTAAGGNASLAGATTIVTGGQVAAGGDLQFTATAGNLTLNAPVLTAAGTLGLSAAGAVQVQPGTSVSAGTDVTIGAGTLAIQQAVLSAGRDVAMTVGGAAGFTDATIVAGRDVTLAAGGLATITRGKIDAAGEISLAADGFAINQANIDPLVIRITAVGDILIADTVMTAEDAIRILAGGTMTVRDSTFDAASVGIRSGGALTLERGLYIIDDVVVFASPTGISTIGRVLVQAGGTDYPGVAFDTRAAGSTPDPLDVIVPDLPNVPANQQQTQVRLPNSDAPGDFGIPSSAPAGTLNFTINANRSAIFLLIDGGNAVGDIETAGRVAVFGSGGTVDLTGTLIDFRGTRLTGIAASALTDSGRPAPSNALTRFRFNGCVISSANCIVVSQAVTIPQAPPQVVDLRLFGGRITDPDVQIPNIAEEDY
ncbi:filamentous hemagglutinin N-terminal domain-containing protein [Roseomonas sp. HF4]|uniref:two-partner secretion domain-containing protein n=1 Tax=Roseomonas sp. HF4 TaxID=2562313 RepID=UPI0010BFF332|nr:filamentous hemagglutinin N-terminal domain-containing protein [Roseomonas sp. HF4]